MSGPRPQMPPSGHTLLAAVPRNSEISPCSSGQWSRVEGGSAHRAPLEHPRRTTAGSKIHVSGACLCSAPCRYGGSHQAQRMGEGSLSKRRAMAWSEGKACGPPRSNSLKFLLTTTSQGRNDRLLENSKRTFHWNSVPSIHQA